MRASLIRRCAAPSPDGRRYALVFKPMRKVEAGVIRGFAVLLSCKRSCRGAGCMKTAFRKSHAMPADRPQLTLLQQREIEAKIVGPLIQAVRAELGDDRALAMLRGVIAELA